MCDTATGAAFFDVDRLVEVIYGGSDSDSLLVLRDLRAALPSFPLPSNLRRSGGVEMQVVLQSLARVASLFGGIADDARVLLSQLLSSLQAQSGSPRSRKTSASGASDVRAQALAREV